ncbi:MarR family winged helix-turn-helix transcriptional regulator [Lacticaseibacillus camelliae]|uniref:MarR family winged helix-turn-helix transcriptional regulator n=1 Tax=Lacticaseibacillus camelliae TaxID=381742 RepID=UPI000A9F41D7|nr:MarR family winged helix-turn-helix transcriptional regulator [Lacticaseibacillus camelliae]
MQNFGMVIKQATNQMNKHMDTYAKQFGLTGSQMSIIDFVGNHGQVLQRDIEAEFAIQRSTATLTLQRMEKSGLIQRTAAATDARQKAVSLTPKATKLKQKNHGLHSGPAAGDGKKPSPRPSRLSSTG